jgi:hypothetical protein
VDQAVPADLRLEASYPRSSAGSAKLTSFIRRYCRRLEQKAERAFDFRSWLVKRSVPVVYEALERAFQVIATLASTEPAKHNRRLDLRNERYLLSPRSLEDCF